MKIRLQEIHLRHPPAFLKIIKVRHIMDFFQENITVPDSPEQGFPLCAAVPVIIVRFHHILITPGNIPGSSEEHTSELQSLMRNSYAVFCLKTNNKRPSHQKNIHTYP